ncbi:hypothetical protein BGZ65_010020 [Modicella reniformis]|uniref:C2H2-type domain-containing protein n=1 Tax=Modicella reniformis TaxID=1440133 RepID=A0A9P6IMQ9_9FUNG|nr:hypothetical protein BGZ65_010020 [Modicella reniformis]
MRRAETPMTPEIFQCDVCTKEFTRRYNYAQHYKTHSPDKEFICHEQGCTSAFHRKADLERHRLRHTGELPIKCLFCDAAFRRVEAQKRHCLQEHREVYNQEQEIKRLNKANRRTFRKARRLL